MKYCFLAALLIIATWWRIASDNTLSEQHITQFYQQQQELMLARQADALCAKLDSHFQSHRATRWENEERQPRDKQKTCADLQQMTRDFAALEHRLGGKLPLEYRYAIHRIQWADDERSAIVEMSYTFTAVGALKTIYGHSRDTLIKNHGHTLMLQSELLV